MPPSSNAMSHRKIDGNAREMESLPTAVAAGYKDFAHIKKDTDLDPLRDREDFQKLIAQLEAKAAAEKKVTPSSEKK